MAPRSPIHQLWLTLGFGVGGLIVNLFPLHLFFGIDLLFGSILTAIPAIMLGGRFGALAGFLAGLPTILHWQHPYALLIFTLEGLVVGWLVRSRRSRVVESELVFWLLVGAPLVAVCYGLLLELPRETALTVFTKQAMNGILNIVLCSLLLIAVAGHRTPGIEPARAIPMRSYLTNVFTLLVLAPILVGVIWYALWFSEKATEDATKDSAAVGRLVTSRLELWSRSALLLVDAVARSAVEAMGNPAELERRIAELPPAMQDFDNFYIADKDGTALAFFPAVNRAGQSLRGLNFADREYVTRVQTARGPFLSDLFRGHRETEEWISVAVAPIRDRERFLGYVAAAVSSGRLREFVGPAADLRERVVVVSDQSGRVVFSTSPDWFPLDRWWPERYGRLEPHDGDVQRILPLRSNAIARWQDGYFLWQSKEVRTGWTVSVLTPMAPFLKELFGVYSLLMGAALFFVLFAFYFSWLVNKRIALPLERLASLATGRLKADEVTQWPARGVIREVNLLTRNLEEASEQIHHSMSLLQQTGAELQLQNAALARANARLEVAANTDVLTGLGNHRRFLERLRQEVERGRPFTLIMVDLDDFKSINDRGGHLAGDQSLRTLAAVIGVEFAGTLAESFRYGGDEFVVLLPGSMPIDGMRLARALVEAVGELQGHPHPLTLSAGVAAFPDHGATPTEVLEAVDAALYHAKHAGKNQVQLAGELTQAMVTDFDKGTETHVIEVIKPLVAAVQAKDAQLFAHTFRLAHNARLVGREMGLSHQELRALELGALLHDVGKLEIPREILTKPERLTDAEFSLIKMHSLWGYEIISSLKVLGDVALVVRGHHERFDGKGYPDGLAGSAIPLGARITAVCDAFDAMTDARPYSKPLTAEEAREELLRNAGSQFDPDVVDHMVKLLDAGQLQVPEQQGRKATGLR